MTWFARGGGTSATSRRTSSSAVSTTAVVPSDHARRNRSDTRPSGNTPSRSSASGGRLT